jgi:hypothetical protein
VVAVLRTFTKPPGVLDETSFTCSYSIADRGCHVQMAALAHGRAVVSRASPALAGRARTVRHLVSAGPIDTGP